MRFFLLLLPALLVACKTIEVAAPLTKIIPPPALNAQVSSITIPIQINLSPYLKEVEKSLPTSFSGEEQQCEGTSFSYRFFREPIVFTFKKDELHYAVDGIFDLKINYCPKCHYLFDEKGSCTVPRIYTSCGIDDPMRRVKVEYSTKINISSNYKFNAVTQLNKFDMLDPCKITVFNYDATAEVKKQIKGELVALEKEIDKQIELVDIRSSLVDVWKELQQPIPIESYGFLYLQPKAISLGKLNFSQNKVDIDLNLGLAPMVVTEKLPLTLSILPEMKPFTKSKGLEMVVDIDASYDSLTSIINTSLKDKEFMFKRKKIILKNILITGTSDSTMIFAVTFDGAKRGVVFLLGKPILDETTQTVSITDIEFELKTKSALLKTAKWLFNDKIINEIKKAASYDLRPMLNDAKKVISTQLNGTITDGVEMEGVINSMKVKSIHLSDNHLIIRTGIVGDLKLKLN
jgi:hypothetical protein